jgi:hypothetical protein
MLPIPQTAMRTRADFHKCHVGKRATVCRTLEMLSKIAEVFDSNAGLEASTPTLPTTRYACGGSNQQPRDAVTPRTLGAVFEASAVTEAAVRYRASAAAVEEPGISM